jgi:hypothetical protein
LPARVADQLAPSLKSFAFKPTALRLGAPFPFDDFCFPLDDLLTMMVGAGTTHTFAVDHDSNRNVSETGLQRLSLSVGPRFDWLVSTAQGHELATYRSADASWLRGRRPPGDTVDRESNAEVADMGDERARLAVINRYTDVHSIERTDQAV